MISDDDLIQMIRDSATEQLPIVVMTVQEIRQFAEKVAHDCVAVIEAPHKTKKDIIRTIKDRYDLAKH